MGLEHKNRVADTTATTGTGSFTLAGATPPGVNGHRTFAAAGFSNGATINYEAESADGSAWEVGQGVWNSAAGTLSRVTVWDSSNAGSLVAFAAGTKNVRNVLVASEIDRYAASVLMAASKTTSGTGWQKAPVSTVDFDTGGIWNVANTRLIPTRAGYYLCTARIRTGTSALATLGFAKNGSLAYIASNDTGSSELSVAGTAVMFFNGTTDYLEVQVFANTSGAAYTAGSDSYLQMFGPITQ